MLSIVSEKSMIVLGTGVVCSVMPDGNFVVSTLSHLHFVLNIKLKGRIWYCIRG